MTSDEVMRSQALAFAIQSSGPSCAETVVKAAKAYYAFLTGEAGAEAAEAPKEDTEIDP